MGPLWKQMFYVRRALEIVFLVCGYPLIHADLCRSDYSYYFGLEYNKILEKLTVQLYD